MRTGPSSSLFSIDAIMSGTVVKSEVSMNASTSPPLAATPSASSAAAAVSSHVARSWSSSSPQSDISAGSPPVSVPIASPTSLFRRSVVASPQTTVSTTASGLRPAEAEAVLTNAAFSAAASSKLRVSGTDVSGHPAVAASRSTISNSSSPFLLPVGLHTGATSVGSAVGRNQTAPSSVTGYGCGDLAPAAAAMLHQFGSVHEVVRQHRRELQHQQYAIQTAVAAAANANKSTSVVRPYPVPVGAQYDPLYCWLQAAAAAQRSDAPGFCGNPAGFFLPSAGRCRAI